MRTHQISQWIGLRCVCYVDILSTALPGVKILRPSIHCDERGYFLELYNARRFTDAGIDDTFVQDNLALSAPTGTVRGLHFQVEPFSQSKLICVVRGAVLDVAVDIRRESPTFGRHVAITVDATEHLMVFIPSGFAHGYCTLEPNCAVMYKVGTYWSSHHERGIRWDDPDLGIPWPVTPAEAVLSAKDRVLPRLRDIG